MHGLASGDECVKSRAKSLRERERESGFFRFLDLDSFDSIELSLLLSIENLNEKLYNFDFKSE